MSSNPYFYVIALLDALPANVGITYVIRPSWETTTKKFKSMCTIIVAIGHYSTLQAIRYLVADFRAVQKYSLIVSFPANFSF